ncbi:MAG: hypothetical protein A2020_12320 [Lentisphaerae bacterium GWF2_45_14]|nr:MAG: hypothetical protein A2020_12320 [Lentisphaerae bacterium GWF2_45_14]
MKEIATITAEVRFVARRKLNDDGKSAWYVLASNQGNLSGVLSWQPVPGEKLILSGTWSEYRGEKQFKFTNARPDIPQEAKTLLHYVCSRTPGIGPKLEEKIWETVGEKWTELKPGDVPRMNNDIVAEFHKQYAEIKLHDEQYQAIAWLIGKGCSQKMAEAAWEKWETETLGVVQENPYRMTELYGYGFAAVDRHREAFNVAVDDRRRLLAGVEYAVRQAQDDGSTLIDVPPVICKAVQLLGVGNSDLVCDIITRLIGDNRLIFFAVENKNVLALTSDYNAEKVIWDFASDGLAETAVAS